MNKRNGIIFGLVFVCLILSFSFASASFFDNIFGKSTGQPIKNSDSDLQKSLSNSNKIISKVGDFFGLNNRYTYYECIDDETSHPPTNPTIKGSIYVEYSDNGGPKQNATFTDSCSTLSVKNNSAVSEYWCKNTPNKKQPVLSVMPCGPGKFCQDGACIGGLVCADSDGGKNYSVYGQTSGYEPFEHKYLNHSDQCLNDDELYEGSCSWTGELKREYVLCANGCGELVCVDPAENGNVINCTDTDGGINAGITGIVTGPSSSYHSQNWSFTDMCTTVQGGTQTYNVAVEGYCSSNGEVNAFWVNCPAGCSNGSCNPVGGATNGCSDTDNGLNYDLKGTVTGTHYGVNGWTLTDNCFKSYNYQEDYLKEGYCKGNQAYYKNIVCEKDSCFDGKCIPKNITQGNQGYNGSENKITPAEEGIKIKDQNEIEDEEEFEDINERGNENSLSKNNFSDGLGKRVGQETGYCKCSGNFENSTCEQFKTQGECVKNTCNGNENSVLKFKKCVWVSSDSEPKDNSNIRFKENNSQDIEDEKSEIKNFEKNNSFEENSKINQSSQDLIKRLKDFFKNLF